GDGGAFHNGTGDGGAFHNETGDGGAFHNESGKETGSCVFSEHAMTIRNRCRNIKREKQKDINRRYVN
ncbi:MAG TPA: hypothetical protein DCM49_06275, partial [Lachnospiraceae bacterium]|nr:hypothetical protein [Lachnospiraceae bacterium]